MGQIIAKVLGSRCSVLGPAAVVVMARAPFAPSEQIKTRLAAAIPDDGLRRNLYAAFLTDVLSMCRRLAGIAVHLAYAADSRPDDFGSIAGLADDVFPQRGSDLGARERHIFEDLFAAGFARVVIIGSDLPTLPAAHVSAAMSVLANGRAAAVLGPAEDGGYYLIGMRTPGDAPVPDLFTDVRWSTRFAMEDTLAAAARAGIATAASPPWYDVDDQEGLRQLRDALAEDPNQAPATAAVLRKIFGANPELPNEP
jgi:rSAM/selenodomain-associated transferase 1